MSQAPDEFTDDKPDNKYKNLRMTLSVIRTIEAEKRTHLAELRTGIGILTIPFSLTTILIATSNYYNIDDVLYFITGLVMGILVLSGIGGYLVAKALQKIRKADRMRSRIRIVTHDLVDDYD